MTASVTDEAATPTPKEAREELYEIFRGQASFEPKARDALELGRQYLGVDNGHLTRIDQETDHWEAIVSTDSPEGRFPPGLELDLGTTYCRRTIEANSQITLHDALNQGWDDDPAFEAHGLASYLGTSFIVDKEPYGTVCFVAEDPREPFSDDETMFAELIGQLLERELEREQHEAQLTRQTNLATVLNRVLRHNLRNDMSVIRGYAQQMADELGDPPHSKTTLDNIDKLLDLSEKARQLEKVVNTDFGRKPTEITGLVEDIAQTVNEDYPDAAVTVEYEDDITAAVLPSLDRALEELIENAAKHSGDSPTLTITVAAVPNAVEIRIVDDGPGLNNQDAEVLKTGNETPLVHGSGLGLWIAHWIVTSHDGSIDVTSTENGTTMTISVPRKPMANADEELTKLTQARDQYQATFEESYDAMVIINDDARILDANPAASTIYGLDSQELLGQPYQRFFPDDFDFDAEWHEFQNAGQIRGTVTVIGADGVERQVEYSATTDVVPGQHLVVSRDVTERKQREQKLQRIEALFKQGEQLGNFGVWECYPDGPVVWTDGVRRIHEVDDDYEPTIEEAIAFYHPEDRVQIEDAVENALETGESFDLELRLITAKSNERWVRTLGKFIESTGDACRGVHPRYHRTKGARTRVTIPQRAIRNLTGRGSGPGVRRGCRDG